MSLPHDFWGSYEESISTLQQFTQAIEMISAYGADSQYVWRGVADAEWPLHSSLVNAYKKKYGALPREPQLRDFERTVLAEARDEWGLDWHATGGRLSALELLAALQHYGVPTRLLDFTFNPLIALWFAVEKHDARDGRVFAIDISRAAVDHDRAVKHDPWWHTVGLGPDNDWTTKSWVWRPPPIEPRIVRQAGCFLLGGVPSTMTFHNVKQGGVWRPMKAAEIRECTCVTFPLVGYSNRAVSAMHQRRGRGKPAQQRAFTLRIDASIKNALRTALERGFGYRHSVLFPDYQGLGRYGRTFR